MNTAPGKLFNGREVWRKSLPARPESSRLWLRPSWDDRIFVRQLYCEASVDVFYSSSAFANYLISHLSFLLMN